MRTHSLVVAIGFASCTSPIPTYCSRHCASPHRYQPWEWELLSPSSSSSEDEEADGGGPVTEAEYREMLRMHKKTSKYRKKARKEPKTVRGVIYPLR